MNYTLLQIVSETSEEKMSLLKMLTLGGWTMVPIAILFVLAIYLLFERYFTINKASKLDNTFMSGLKDMVLDGNVIGAQKLCERTNSPIARMLEKGISRIGNPLKNIEVSIENVGKLEIYKLERGMAMLATISGAAPMLGLLGTVIGMIKTFYNLAKNASGSGNVDINLLSGGIYEAMVTTVAGLVVGLIAYVAYNTLTAMIEKVVYKMEAHSVEFFDILLQPSKN